MNLEKANLVPDVDDAAEVDDAVEEVGPVVDDGQHQQRAARRRVPHGGEGGAVPANLDLTLDCPFENKIKNEINCPGKGLSNDYFKAWSKAIQSALCAVAKALFFAPSTLKLTSTSSSF